MAATPMAAAGQRQQMATIFVRQLRIYAHHGVLRQERAVGAFFFVNVSVTADIAAAMATDDVADTISYADVADIVRREMAVPSALLEHVAGRVARAILIHFPTASAVELDITKQNPPMGADCGGAGVALRMTRDAL